jgi:hypothetical protein
MTSSDDRVNYARVDRLLDHDVDRVWEIAGTFGSIERWVDGVTACAVDGAGVGAVRHVARGGNIVHERLDRRDPTRRELTYTILDPSPMPAIDVVSTLTLEEAGPGKTRLVWSSSAAQLSVAPDVLGRRIERFYSDSIDGLERFLSGV